LGRTSGSLDLRNSERLGQENRASVEGETEKLRFLEISIIRLGGSGGGVPVLVSDHWLLPRTGSCAEHKIRCFV
jgi:hypothetical protein